MQFTYLIKITDFCVGYECNDDESDDYDNRIYKWKPIAKGCVCAEEKLWNNAWSELEFIDSKFDDYKDKDGDGRK